MNMKKILFLCFNYPKGEFGPSTMCSVRIMRELVATGEYEVHCLSYNIDGKDTYDEVPGIILHKIPLKPDLKKRSRFVIHFCQVLMLPFFPYAHLCSDRRHYRESIRAMGGLHFDMVFAQYYPEQSLKSGLYLKKSGIGDKLMVTFWDNVYGKLPRSIVPKSFALRRQRKAENKIARYADVIVSLYPLKSFHKEYGDVPNAFGKRRYLGIPSVTRPRQLYQSAYLDVIKQDKINILFSGTIFKKEFVLYFVKLLNSCSQAKDINLIVFTRSLSQETIEDVSNTFKGSIQIMGWIPLGDLLALYPHVDFFVSFPGVATAICSKVYEYMSYGKPIMLLYEDDSDVNIATFSKYPICMSFDTRLPVQKNVEKIEDYITTSKGQTVPYEEVERVFKDDTASAYIRLINEYITK